MKISMTKQIEGRDHQVEVIIGEKAFSDQTTSIQIDIYIDSELVSSCGHYNSERQYITFGTSNVQDISGSRISGFTVSDSDALMIDKHMRQTTERYQAAFAKRVAGLLSGVERVKIWLYGMTITMVTLEYDSGILDWIEVRDTAAKQWLAKYYPLIDSLEYEYYDLHRGIMSTADVVRKIPEAEPSSEEYISMGGELAPKYALVPLPALLKHTAAKKYQELLTH